MRDTPGQALTPFASRQVDIHAPRAVGTIVRRLREDGLVVVDGLVTREAVARFASRVMSVVPHPHGSADGVTVIRNTGADAHLIGRSGFGMGELEAHTDRSSVPQPPRLMLLVCLRPAAEGGVSLLADGRDVLGRLSKCNTQAAVRFSTPRTAYFGTGTGHASQVFTVQAKGRVSIRLRLDGLARWSPLVQPFLPALRSAITDCQGRLRLGPGQGYLLDNHRWLHARTGFTGDRLCVRVLGDPRTPFPDGFVPESRRVLLPGFAETPTEEFPGAF
ncbi:TauD/TfdA family dioxygenase [Streptomyces acidiscabies]|uniref:TauD/TfdA family dioxygenase n=1 Tax=Streptomyces acidiscabies TaxID=42234 RepID=UPI000952605A|nr:TauD/TfdA family dioxygenase [Streptomyces acidiscabies]